MRRLRNLIFLLLIAGAFWHFYGDAFQRDGIQGIFNEAQSDFNQFREDPRIVGFIDTVNEEAGNLVGRLSDLREDGGQDAGPPAEKPELESPEEQSFSVHNVEIGDSREDVEQQAGQPQRSSKNEYGTDWVAYHDNYQNFFMVAYDSEEKVAGLYTNQDLVSSTLDISFQSSRDQVQDILDQPLDAIRKGLVNYKLNDTGEYHTFDIDENYVTIFYDLHENNTVTAIQIISKELEEEKPGFFGEPDSDLMEGFEYQLFDLTNASRAVHGLPILSWEDPLRQTARDHSIDMADNNYFSHTNLDGQSPFDRMEEDNISFRMAGENLASGQTSSIFAHEGLMNSLGHRENILKEGYRAVAVGVAFNESSQPFYTVNFLTK